MNDARIERASEMIHKKSFLVAYRLKKKKIKEVKQTKKQELERIKKLKKERKKLNIPYHRRNNDLWIMLIGFIILCLACIGVLYFTPSENAEPTEKYNQYTNGEYYTLSGVIMGYRDIGRSYLYIQIGKNEYKVKDISEELVLKLVGTDVDMEVKFADELGYKGFYYISVYYDELKKASIENTSAQNQNSSSQHPFLTKYYTTKLLHLGKLDVLTENKFLIINKLLDLKINKINIKLKELQ